MMTTTKTKTVTLDVDSAQKGEVSRLGVVVTPHMKKTASVSYFGAMQSSLTLNYLTLGDRRRGGIDAVVQEQTNFGLVSALILTIVLPYMLTLYDLGSGPAARHWTLAHCRLAPFSPCFLPSRPCPFVSPASFV